MVQWYAKGVYFKCTQCGKCCTGAPGYVWVTPEEIASMAEVLKMPLDLFYRRYIRRVGQRLSLIEKKSGDCVFLQDGRLCQVYQARPKQCRTFPFWSEALKSPEAWDKTAEACEGINHPDASYYSAEEVGKKLQED